MSTAPTDSVSTVAEPILLTRLRGHFECDPALLPVVEQEFAIYERPNLHLTVEAVLGEPGRQTELIGVLVLKQYHEPRLALFTRPSAAQHFEDGPVKFADISLAGGQLACVKRGLYLFRHDDQPVAMLLQESGHAYRPVLLVEVMASEQELAQSFLRRLTRQVRHGPAYRGHALSIQTDCYHNLTVHFHTLPRIRRDQIILPEELLRRLERHTLTFSKQVEKLRAAGRHIKRGILLYGAPGTGKTLSAMYLAAQMAGRTVLLLTGEGIGSIETACQLARMLEPATVILEDADLIGTVREHQTVGANALLFELLNQMDGLAEDIDILFILTTNRPDVLEPALAARPGRIDQAIEVPLPDADCRERLLELYGRGLKLELEDRARWVARTEGVSAAFIRELLRKAAVFAAEEDDDLPLVVCDRHLAEALKELVVGGALTQSLLGGKPLATND